MTCLVAQRIANGDGGLSASPAWIVIEGDMIVAVGSGTPPANAEDLGSLVLAPGFIDCQVNGVGNVDFATASVGDSLAAVDELVAGGCTSLLVTLCSAPLPAYSAMLTRLAEVRAQRHQVIGVHLEGPFLGGAPGAHPTALVRAVDVDWLHATLDAHGDLVRLVTLAPEADPTCAAIRALRARGVVVALGHSLASYDDAGRAADAGATMVTHCFNGMGPLHHRAPGIPGAALDDHRLVPSVIADLVHVHPAVLRLVVSARPDAVAVSDAVGALVPRDGAAYLDDGTLAGSIVTMGEVVTNLVDIGVAPGQAVRMATGNPARVLGLADRGRVGPGCRADLVALDPESLVVRAVWCGGERVAL